MNGATQYQYFMAMSYLCLERARGHQNKDKDLFQFYLNASSGFKNKALQTKVDI